MTINTNKVCSSIFSHTTINHSGYPYEQTPHFEDHWLKMWVSREFMSATSQEKNISPNSMLFVTLLGVSC